MSDLKDQLIKLGSENPDLQKHLRPILDKISTLPGLGDIYERREDKAQRGGGGPVPEDVFHEEIKEPVDRLIYDAFPIKRSEIVDLGVDPGKYESEVEGTIKYELGMTATLDNMMEIYELFADHFHSNEQAKDKILRRKEEILLNRKSLVEGDVNLWLVTERGELHLRVSGGTYIG